MANQSKLYFENLVGRKCNEIAHTYTDGCFLAVLLLGRDVFKRMGLFFFAPIYLIQLCLQGRNVTPTYLKQHVRAYLQSTAFAALYASSFLAATCSLRNLLGKYTKYTLAFIPGLLSGLTILLEHSSRRSIVTTTFVNLALECLLRWLEIHKNLKRTRGSETVVFMLLSAIVMYLLRTKQSNSNKTPHLWFFMPPKMKKKVQKKDQMQDANHNVVPPNHLIKICPHPGPCWKDVLKSMSKYMGIGFGLQLLRSLLPHQRSMQSKSKNLLKDRNTFLFALFLGGYVGLYKTVSCLLNRYNGNDSEVHAILAGFLAGSSYYLQPNTTLLLSAITTILQVIAMRGVSNGLIPDSPIMGGLVFSLCNGIIVHSMVVEPQVTPRFFVNLLNFGTNGWTNSIHRSVRDILTKEPSLIMSL